MLRIVLAGSAALLIWGCAAEAEEPAIGAPALELTGRVVDAADILSPAFEAELTAKLATLEEDTKVQLVVATTPDLGGRAIEDYALDLASAWEVGDAQRDDGLLVLVAPTDRKVRIEVGYGLEASVRDEDAAAIIRDTIIPSFRKGDYAKGIEAGVDGLIREVTPVPMKDAA